MKLEDWKFFTLYNWLWKSDLGPFWRPMWTSVKVKSKKYFSFTDFFAKITSTKLHHWGHTNLSWCQLPTHLSNAESLVKDLNHEDCYVISVGTKKWSYLSLWSFDTYFQVFQFWNEKCRLFLRLLKIRLALMPRPNAWSLTLIRQQRSS